MGHAPLVQRPGRPRHLGSRIGQRPARARPAGGGRAAGRSGRTTFRPSLRHPAAAARGSLHRPIFSRLWRARGPGRQGSVAESGSQIRRSGFVVARGQPHRRPGRGPGPGRPLAGRPPPRVPMAARPDARSRSWRRGPGPRRSRGSAAPPVRSRRGRPSGAERARSSEAGRAGGQRERLPCAEVSGSPRSERLARRSRARAQRAGRTDPGHQQQRRRAEANHAPPGARRRAAAPAGRARWRPSPHRWRCARRRAGARRARGTLVPGVGPRSRTSSATAGGPQRQTRAPPRSGSARPASRPRWRSAAARSVHSALATTAASAAG